MTPNARRKYIKFNSLPGRTMPRRLWRHLSASDVGFLLSWRNRQRSSFLKRRFPVQIRARVFGARTGPAGHSLAWWRSVWLGKELRFYRPTDRTLLSEGRDHGANPCGSIGVRRGMVWYCVVWRG